MTRTAVEIIIGIKCAIEYYISFDSYLMPYADLYKIMRKSIVGKCSSQYNGQFIENDMNLAIINKGLHYNFLKAMKYQFRERSLLFKVHWEPIIRFLLLFPYIYWLQL